METDNGQATQLTEVIDGFIVDELGEIVGHTSFADGFHVTDRSGAEWVLRKIMEADAQIVAMDIMAKAIMDNIDRDRKRQQQRRAFFEARYGAEVIAYAKANLKGKSKTWTCPYGSVSFRSTKPSIEITDEEKAIAWVKTLAIPGAIKVTEKLLLSEVKEKLLADPPTPGHGIEVKAAGESAKISSGVES